MFTNNRHYCSGWARPILVSVQLSLSCHCLFTVLSLPFTVCSLSFHTVLLLHFHCRLRPRSVGPRSERHRHPDQWQRPLHPKHHRVFRAVSSTQKQLFQPLPFAAPLSLLSPPLLLKVNPNSLSLHFAASPLYLPMRSSKAGSVCVMILYDAHDNYRSPHTNWICFSAIRSLTKRCRDHTESVWR